MNKLSFLVFLSHVYEDENFQMKHYVQCSAPERHLSYGTKGACDHTKFAANLAHYAVVGRAVRYFSALIIFFVIKHAHTHYAITFFSSLSPLRTLPRSVSIFLCVYASNVFMPRKWLMLTPGTRVPYKTTAHIFEDCRAFRQTNRWKTRGKEPHNTGTATLHPCKTWMA